MVSGIGYNSVSSYLLVSLPPATSHHPLPSLGSPNCELSFAWIILQLYRAAVIAPAAELAHVVYEYEYECECEYE